MESQWHPTVATRRRHLKSSRLSHRTLEPSSPSVSHGEGVVFKEAHDNQCRCQSTPSYLRRRHCLVYTLRQASVSMGLSPIRDRT
ncbi:hypothetical protein K523DRAFT_325268 [Schizophyllum commune Tattone D]|nr:hypothetical protein K523DRAFT_325268 [Schizophyllum commune Tattone D]